MQKEIVKKYGLMEFIVFGEVPQHPAAGDRKVVVAQFFYLFSMEKPKMLRRKILK